MKDHVRPLPSYLIQRYHGWKATTGAWPMKGSVPAPW